MACFADDEVSHRKTDYMISAFSVYFPVFSPTCWVEIADFYPGAKIVSIGIDNVNTTKLRHAIRREIHYRLLRSSSGKMLQNLLIVDSYANDIVKDIQKIRNEFRSPLSVSGPAQTVAMSTASFHGTLNCNRNYTLTI